MEAQGKVEVIRPLRRNLNQASRAMQSKDYNQAVTMMKDVIEVKCNTYACKFILFEI